MRTYRVIEDLRDFHQRLKWVGFAVMAVFILIFGRYVWLQIIRFDYYSTRAEDNRIAIAPVEPARGKILDRNGLELAHNASTYSLEVDPGKSKNIAATLDALAAVLPVDARDRSRFQRLRSDFRGGGTLPVRTGLSDADVARFYAFRYRFPEAEIKTRFQRKYPHETLAAHALGQIGRLSNDDETRVAQAGKEQNYLGATHYGKTGVERYYEFRLRGEIGFAKIEVDALGREIRKLAESPPQPGENMMLNLDATLQQIVEEAFGTRKGALVAVDPDNGGILAYVSMPSFDPNLFVDGIDSINWGRLNTSPDRPLLNRASHGLYPPGSTFKPFMALASLHYDVRGPEKEISDPGYFNFGNNTFRDDKKGGHGRVNMEKSIVVSCDTYYYTLANELGIDRIARYMASWGFGQRTGVDLDSEVAGVLPSPEWKMRRFKTPQQKKWYAGETISIGIGQGYNAYTPLQLAMAVAAIANNGTLYRPRLARALSNPVTGVSEPVMPEIVRKTEATPEQLAVIQKAMIGVTKSGTAASVFSGAGYVSAGKTGTAQVFSLKGDKYQAHQLKQHLLDHALYIGYAPAEKPRVALAVVVENAGFGAVAAAPIARKVFDYVVLGKRPPPPKPSAPAKVPMSKPAANATELPSDVGTPP